MSDQPETLDAILAEMRDFAKPLRVGGDLCNIVALPATISIWADRIERAHKQERAQWRGETDAAKEARNRIACRMRYEFAAKCRACKAEPGNAAAMREALEAFVESVEWLCDGDESGRLKRQFGVLLSDARAAIAAPARNCDRFATEDEAREAYWAYREPLEFNNKPFVAITEWLFAPAEGGAK